MTTTAKRFLANLAAATLVLLTLMGVSAPAQAAACEYGKGVTVVVQGQGFNSVSCVSTTKFAKDAFPAAGYPLTYTRQFPGFVCRVSGKPAADPCVTASPADAYWGLFHADGKDQSWKYASVGVGSLKTPEGSWVAFKFQGTGSTQYPSGTPVGPKPPASPRPTRTPKPTSNPTANSTARPGASALNPTATPSAGASAGSPSAPPSASASADASASPSASASGAVLEVNEEASADADEANESSTGTILWTVLGLVLLLGVGTAVVIRNRR